jgi:CYTH domain-containing protein
MTVSLKYAVVERERRFVVDRLPDGVSRTARIADRYLTGTRLRLREVVEQDGTVVHKLGHKVRLTSGPQEVACTSMYLDDAEWAALGRLPAAVLRKTRHWVERDGILVVVDEHEDGSLVAEIDDADLPAAGVPAWLVVLRDVSGEEDWTGAALARRSSSSEPSA